MHETATLIVTIILAMITWTATVASLVLWLTSKFRALEKALYREMDKHRREDDRQFNVHATRIQRLELRAFGFSAPNGPLIAEPEPGDLQ